MTLKAMPGTVQELVDEIPDDVTAAVVVYRLPDPEHPQGDSWESRWSKMSISDLCFAVAILQRRILILIEESCRGA